MPLYPNQNMQQATGRSTSPPSKPNNDSKRVSKPHPVSQFNTFLQNNWVDPAKQQARKQLAQTGADYGYQRVDGVVMPVAKRHPLSSNYRRMVDAIAPTFQAGAGSGSGSGIATVSVDIPTALNSLVGKPTHYNDRVNEVRRNWANKLLQKPKTFTPDIAAMEALKTGPNRNKISPILALLRPYERERKISVGSLLAVSNDNPAETNAIVADFVPNYPTDIAVLKRHGLIKTPAEGKQTIILNKDPKAERRRRFGDLEDLMTFGYLDAANRNHGLTFAQTPEDDLAQIIEHEVLSHAADTKSSQQLYELHESNDALDDKHGKRVDNQSYVDYLSMFPELVRKYPVSEYTRKFAEFKGAQSTFQREATALITKAKDTPNELSDYPPELIEQMRSLPSTVNSPADFDKQLKFFQSNPQLLGEGNRFISSMFELTSQLSAVVSYLKKEEAKGEGADQEKIKALKIMKQMLEERLLEAGNGAAFLASSNAYQNSAVAKTASNNNNNKKDTAMLTKAASAVYREKLAKNAPMTDAVVGNAKKRKQQNRSMNGFLKQKDKEQSDQTTALNKSAAAEFDPDNLSGSNYDAFRKAWAVIKGLGKGALYGGLAGGGVGLLTDSVLAGKDQRNAKISILTPGGAVLGALAGIPIGISSGLKNERMEREKERRSAYQQALMDKLLRGAVDPAAGAAMLAATKE